MSYPNGFPGMTKFQAKNGGKGVTSPSGIVPYNKGAPAPLVPPKTNFFRNK